MEKFSIGVIFHGECLREFWGWNVYIVFFLGGGEFRGMSLGLVQGGCPWSRARLQDWVSLLQFWSPWLGYTHMDANDFWLAILLTQPTEIKMANWHQTVFIANTVRKHSYIFNSDLREKTKEAEYWVCVTDVPLTIPEPIVTQHTLMCLASVIKQNRLTYLYFLIQYTNVADRRSELLCHVLSLYAVHLPVEMLGCYLEIWWPSLVMVSIETHCSWTSPLLNGMSDDRLSPTKRRGL